MCQSRVVTFRDGREEVIMEDVVTVRPQGSELYLEDLYGQQRTVKARIRELQLMDHRIVVEEA
ncbi:MAG TPA: CooT family nickel-binding protein [Firmicutes bacterium]|nr:CooT family nickel-binding protein [Bacillota bacterium]